MLPVLLHVGPVHVYSYAAMLALAFLLAGSVFSRELQRRALDPRRAGAMTFMAAATGISGASLHTLAERRFHDAASTVVLDHASAMTWYGGFLVATGAIYLYSRWHDMPFRRVLDAAAPALMLGYGVGRIGCHLAGDGDYGFPTSAPWGVNYAAGVYPPSQAFALTAIASRYPGGVVPDSIPCHPVALYECVVALAAFGLLSRLSRRCAVAGRLFSIYLVIAGGARFGFEFLRPTPRVLWGLSEAQIISCALVLIGAAGLARGVSSSRVSEKIEAAKPAGNGGRIAVSWPAASLAFLVAGSGCTSTVAFTPRPNEPNNTVWLQGVRFEPAFVRDASLKLGPSDTYWLLPGEQTFVKWQDYHVRAPFDGSTWDCNFCAELRARSRGQDVCPLPDGKRPVFAFSAAQVLVQESPSPVPNSTPQSAGPFQWDDGCFIPSAAADQPDFGPMGVVSVTVNRSATWLAEADIGGATFPSRSPDSATFSVVPQGGRLAMSPRRIMQYVDPSTRQPDPKHWAWKVDVTTDPNGTPRWSESFSPGVAVGHARVLKGTFVNGVFSITATVVPSRIRVYERIDPNLTDPFRSDIFYCFSDPTAADGDVDLTRCRSGGGQVTRKLVTPAYDLSLSPPSDAAVRTPLTWIVEFSDALPVPTLNAGEDLAIEFTLLDAASVP